MPLLKYVNDTAGPRFESKPITAPDGTAVGNFKNDGWVYWCPSCSGFITGLSCYDQNKTFKVVDGESYCLAHYSQAVDVALADRRLKQEK